MYIDISGVTKCVSGRTLLDGDGICSSGEMRTCSSDGKGNVKSEVATIFWSCMRIAEARRSEVPKWASWIIPQGIVQAYRVKLVGRHTGSNQESTGVFS